MISVGKSTPAIHGSKYTSSSCKPRKYQGALLGLGETVGLAGSSSGALRKMDHRIRTIAYTNAMTNSMKIRYGKTSTFSLVSSCSTVGSPFSMRWSLVTAFFMAYQVKKLKINIMPTMGTLSGVLTIWRKCSSVSPNAKKASPRSASGMLTQLDVAIRGNPTNNAKTTTSKVKIETGDEAESMAALMASSIPPPPLSGGAACHSSGRDKIFGLTDYAGDTHNMVR